MISWCRILCSTGAFTRVPHLTDHRAILRYGPGLPADGLEVMFHLGWYAQVERVADELLATGLKFPAVHAEKSTGSAMGSTDQVRGRLILPSSSIRSKSSASRGQSAWRHRW
jgi:hypothetical protein